MLYHIFAIFSGAMFVLAVVAGIGPQNLNIISQGIKRNHELAVAITCFLGDITLILLASIGLSVSDSHNLILIINILGLVFIVWYLYIKIVCLFKKRNNIHIDSEILTKNQAILRALALTWLNPLVMLDTIVIIGGAASRYSGLDKIDFVIGAILADLLWVFGITYLARTFSHRLNKASIWLILDITTIILMIYIGYKTVLFII